MLFLTSQPLRTTFEIRLEWYQRYAVAVQMAWYHWIVSFFPIICAFRG